MLRIRVAWLVVLVALILSACGGGDDAGSEGEDSESSADSSVLTEAVASLESCLTDAGLEVVPEDTQAFGVESPHDHLEVSLDSASFDKAYAVDLWVFETPEAAEEARTPITLETKDDERGKVIGSVVVNYEIIPDEDDAEQVEACIEP